MTMTIQSINIRLWIDPATTTPATTKSTAPVAATTTDDVADGRHVARTHGKRGCCQPGRAHVAQTLHQLDRQVRHAIKDALRDMDELPEEGRQELIDLAKDFRQQLQTVFHDAGRGHEFDRDAVAEKVRVALQDLLTGLDALRAKYATTEETPGEAPTTTKPTDPVSPAEPSTADALLGFSAYA